MTSKIKLLRPDIIIEVGHSTATNNGLKFICQLGFVVLLCPAPDAWCYNKLSFG